MTRERLPSELFDDAPAEGEALEFGFDGLAQALADYALNAGNRTPFTVVVKGPWGRGKTTLLRATRAVLDAAAKDSLPEGRRKPYTIEFNVWKYPSEDTILAGLLGALLDAMRTGPMKDQLKVAVEGRKGEIVKRLLSAAAPWLDVGALTGSRFDDVQSKRAFHDTFRSLFAQLWLLWQEDKAVLQDLDRRNVESALHKRSDRAVLAVFLDDLDRCSETRMLQTLQALNLFLDLPGVCFYVGVDWKRVLEILSESPLKERAESFLEKIVQVACDLPEVTDNEAADYTRSLLEGRRLGSLLEEPLENDGPADAPRPVETLGAVLAHNHPRHVKRALNDLSMRLSALDHTGRLSLDGEDDEGSIPVTAVIALHLVREKCSAEQRVQLDRHEGVRWLLEAWASHHAEASDPTDAIGSEARGGDETGGFWASLFEETRLAPSLRCLDSLGPHQQVLLVHHSAPPRADTAQGAPRRLAHRGAASPLETDFISINGGRFPLGQKGVAEPVHQVTLSPYRIARFPVTCAEYAAFVQALDYPPPRDWKDAECPRERASHPVVNVSWNDAVAYCRWLGEQLDGAHIALPTEAQWEFAARGVEGRTYPWGDDEPTPERANFGDASRGTTPAGSFPAGRTPEGVEDMAGNVWEWCADWYGDYADEEQTDPRGPARGKARVLRGGSFGYRPGSLRAAFRRHGEPDNRGVFVGFRVVWLSPEDS